MGVLESVTMVLKTGLSAALILKKVGWIWNELVKK